MNSCSSAKTQQIERWLSTLISTYGQYPSQSMAACIVYYIQRIKSLEDFTFFKEKQCDYLLMEKYWIWQKNKHQ